MDEPSRNDADPEVASRVLDKLRTFVQSLDDDERSVLGALLAPGVARAYADEAEVVGFMVDDWLPARLPSALSEQVRSRHFRIETDDSPDL